MVQRLARGPFKAEIRVRFPLALPKIRNLESLIATHGLLIAEQGHGMLCAPTESSLHSLA
jgi:hypothetical protein